MVRRGRLRSRRRFQDRDFFLLFFLRRDVAVFAGASGACREKNKGQQDPQTGVLGVCFHVDGWSPYFEFDSREYKKPMGNGQGDTAS